MDTTPNLKNIQVKKVKVLKTKTRIEYELPVPGSDEPDLYSLECSDKPCPSFYEAISALGPHVASICDMPDDWEANLEIKGVSFSWTESVMGATITALKPLKKCSGPLVINTPHKTAEPTSETGDESVCFEPNTIYALQKVIDETLAYIGGKRDQPSLPFDDGPAPPESDKDEALMRGAFAPVLQVLAGANHA